MRRGKPYQGVSRCGVSRRICATCYLPTSFSTRWTGAAELRRRFLVYPDSRVPAHRQTYLCARMRRNNFPHENTRVPRRSAFWPKPQKAPKALFMLPPAASTNKPARNPPGATGCAFGAKLQARSRPKQPASGRLAAVPTANGAMYPGIPKRCRLSNGTAAAPPPRFLLLKTPAAPRPG